MILQLFFCKVSKITPAVFSYVIIQSAVEDCLSAVESRPEKKSFRQNLSIVAQFKLAGNKLLKNLLYIMRAQNVLHAVATA